MSGFLYFIPGQVGKRAFDACGLAGRFACGCEQTRVNAGGSPDGAPGVVFSEPSPAGLPTPINWHDADGYSIGWHTPFPPGPDDLHNGVDVTGFNIELCDGNLWRVPLVIPFRDLDPERECGLPQVYKLSNVGDPRDTERGYAETVKAEYMSLVREAETFLSALHDESTDPKPCMVGYCANLLAVCYRIGRAEVLALGLLDKECANRMVALSIDCGERLEAARMLIAEARDGG